MGSLVTKPQSEVYDLRIVLPQLDGTTFTVDVEAPPGRTSEAKDLWTTPGKLTKIIAVTGQFDSGKTMIVARLSKRPLPSGTGVRTQGISGAYIEDQKMLILDSAGTDEVRLEHFKDLNADLAEEAREHFSSDVLMEMSSVFIHVVEKSITRPAMRCLWGHFKRIQENQRSDMTVVYNLYPHEEDGGEEKKVKEIIEGFRQDPNISIDFEDHWNFTTRHDGVPVHHYFILDDTWSKGREINNKQIEDLWQHLKALRGDDVEALSLQELTVAPIKKITPHYVEPQGLPAERVVPHTFDQITRKPENQVTRDHDYTKFADIEVTLPENAKMQTKRMLANDRGGYQVAGGGFQPEVQKFTSKENVCEEIILINAANTRLIKCVGDKPVPGADDKPAPGEVCARKPDLGEADKPAPGEDYARKPAPGEARVRETFLPDTNWKCLHIEINKAPHIEINKAPFLDQDHHWEYLYDLTEESGIFEMYYPPVQPLGKVSAKGPLKSWSRELENGMLKVSLEFEAS